jgi:transposase-like protein
LTFIENQLTLSTMQTDKRTAPFLIEQPRQIAALASATRQEIVDAAVASGAFTVAELARRLDRPADALYFHVRLLERVGLLLRTGESGEGRARAAVYDVPGRPLKLRYGSSVQVARRIGPVLDGILRLARRDVRRALERGDALVEGPVRDTWGARARGWLGRSELERANQLLQELLDLVQAGTPRPGAQPVALVLALAPLAPHARGAQRASARKGDRS